MVYQAGNFNQGFPAQRRVRIADLKLWFHRESERASSWGFGFHIIFMDKDCYGYRAYLGPYSSSFWQSITEGYDKECHIGKSTEGKLFCRKRTQKTQKGKVLLKRVGSSSADS